MIKTAAVKIRNARTTQHNRGGGAPNTRGDELLEPTASSDDAELPGGQGRPPPREVELREVRRHEWQEQGDGQQPRRPRALPLEIVADV